MKKINFKSEELETEECVTFRGGTIHLCTYVSLYIHLGDIQIDTQIFNNDTRYCIKELIFYLKVLIFV